MNKPKWSKGAGHTVFPYIAKLFDLKTLVETGTGTGSMIAYLHPVFDEVYSFETDDFNYSRACDMFQFVPKIHLIPGDSGQLLEPLLASLPNSKTFFWLDAHGTPGSDDGPLAKEIQAIQKYRPDALIAIDDVGQDTHHDVNLTAVQKAGVNLAGWTMDYRFNRVMFLYRQGEYSIPVLD